MLTFKVKNTFFDRPAVQRSMSRARLRALSRAGSFIRTRARSSLRRRKKPSSPGSPPSVHAPSGSVASLKTILFAYDSSADTVIVGPVGLNQVNDTTLGLRTTVPGLHERGESVSILESRFVPNRGQPTQWRRANRKRRSRVVDWGKTEIRRRTVNYPKRPFMRPALEAEQKKIADLFKNSIRPS